MDLFEVQAPTSILSWAAWRTPKQDGILTRMGMSPPHPLLASHGEAGGGECVQRTLIHVGVAADRKQSQVPALLWLGRVCWLGLCHYQNYGVFLGILQERQAVAQVRACLVGGNEDEGHPKHYGRLTLVWGRQHIMGRGPTRAECVADWTTCPTLRGGLTSRPIFLYQSG